MNNQFKTRYYQTCGKAIAKHVSEGEQAIEKFHNLGLINPSMLHTGRIIPGHMAYKFVPQIEDAPPWFALFEFENDKECEACRAILREMQVALSEGDQNNG